MMAALAHSNTAGFKAKVKRAKETIEYAYNLCQKPFVSWSLGKDSNAMLWLVLEYKPDAIVRVMTGGETRLLYPEFDDIVNWWQAKFPNMFFEEVLIDHIWDDNWAEASFDEHYRSFYGGWEKYFHANGDWDGVFIGLRKEEAFWRSVWTNRRLEGCPYAIRQYSPNREDSKSGVYRISPVDNWSTQDVMAMNYLHNMPLLPEYEKEGGDARTKLRLGRQAMEWGQLAKMRERNPEKYNVLIQRFPELAKD